MMTRVIAAGICISRLLGTFDKPLTSNLGIADPGVLLIDGLVQVKFQGEFDAVAPQKGAAQ
jgi:hypothetical protein